MIDEMRKLKEMLDEGLITQADYNIAKEQIIRRENTDSDNHNTEQIKENESNYCHASYDPPRSIPVDNEPRPEIVYTPYADLYERAQHIQTDNFEATSAGRDESEMRNMGADSVSDYSDRNDSTKDVIDGKKKKGLLAILSVLLAASIGFNIFQFANSRSILSTQESSLADLEKQVGELQALVEQQKTTISSYEKEANGYYTIWRAAKSGNVGRASSQFYVDNGIVVVSKNDKNQKITLTTAFSAASTIDVSYSGSSAELSFDNDNWYDSTTMTVVPHRKGVTVATFSNDINSKTFKVIIIVVD